MKYYSQLGQDRFLDEEIFKRKRDGFYVDVGAVDGLHFNNTLFFERERHWKGMCIEPNPIEFRKLRKSGRNCIMENYAISEKAGKVDFLVIDGYGKGLSGIVDAYHPKHLERIDDELKGKSSTRHKLKVKTIQLQKLFDKHNVTHVDYCSIDVEGASIDRL